MLKSKKIYKTPKKSSGGGAYGTYYVLDEKNKIGLKSVGRSRTLKQWRKLFQEEFECFLNESIHDWVNESDDYNEVLAPCYEFAAMRLFAERTDVPDAHDVVWVKIGNKIRMGILMQHIDGETFQDHYCWKEAASECDRLYDIFLDAPVHVTDWHTENVMIDKEGNKYRIDFSPGHFKVRKDAREEFSLIVAEKFFEMIESFPK